MDSVMMRPIGRVRSKDGAYFVALDGRYIPALKELDGFGHVCVLYWCDRCDTAEARGTLTVEAPYVGSPREIGVFATRSPARPNPIALTVCRVLRVDQEKAALELEYIDAEDNSPVIDLKPYTPSLDRVAHPSVPEWCEKWPMSLEESATFDWDSVFRF